MLHKIPGLLFRIIKIVMFLCFLLLAFIYGSFYISEYWGTGLPETTSPTSEQKKSEQKSPQEKPISKIPQLESEGYTGALKASAQIQQDIQKISQMTPAQTKLESKPGEKEKTDQAVGAKTNEAQAVDAQVVDERAKNLLSSVQQLLQKTAEQRQKADQLPSREDFLVAVPPWTETREDQEDVIRSLLDSTLQIVTDSPIVDYQKQLNERRKVIATLKSQIYTLRERRIDVPQDSLLPAMIKETVASIDEKIQELTLRITENEKVIVTIKTNIKNDFKARSIELSDEQLDLLLGSVIGGDLVKLVAAFEAARLIDGRLGTLMAQNNESLDSARRYFAMHAALYAMLLHAQNEVIHRIEKVYLVKLQTILTDLKGTRTKTEQLMKDQNRPDQHRTLLANRKAQDFAEQVATFYRDYLITQRDHIHKNRERTMKDLSIADNTFATVEASFQLRSLIEDAKASFKALEKLEAPGFGHVFQNEELRREFEKLTEKLAVPSS